MIDTYVTFLLSKTENMKQELKNMIHAGRISPKDYRSLTADVEAIRSAVEKIQKAP